MIKAILIDDEPLARAVLKEYLSDYADITVVQECNDGFEGVKAIQQHKPELIFLDIQMPKINGFEMLELIEHPPGIIFTTAFDEFALKAFEAHAVDYLLKPFSKERFGKALHKWKEHQHPPVSMPIALLETAAQSPQQQERVVVKINGKIKIIPVGDIEYLEASDDYVRIITKEGSFLKNKTMQFFEDSLPPSEFVRVHRSYILHVGQVTRIEPYEKDQQIALLRGGARIPISKSGYARLKQVLGI
jgi:two-component system LytT family response regulator